MASAKHEYIPGVCNIGKAEIRTRTIMAWGALVLTVVLWGGLIATKSPPAWRLSVFGPAMFAAMGFLQAWWHFCAAFGFGGVFNFGPSVGKTDTVEQAEARREDRLTALKIVGLATVISAAVAATAYFLPI